MSNAVDEFRSGTECGVRRELNARFDLIATASLFFNQGDGLLDDMHGSDHPSMQTNLLSALVTLALNLRT